MLFYLTNSLITPTSDPEYVDVYHAIDNILKAAEERRHRVMGDFEILEWFSSFYADTNPRKGVLLKMIHNFAMDVMPPGITECVKVVKAVDAGFQEEEENGKRVYAINYRRFRMSSSLESARIIGEDENDAKLYAQISRWFRIKKSYSYDVNIRFEGGGGKNTHRKIKAHKDLNNIFVCIIDTDEKYPGGPKGDTYNFCDELQYNIPLERLYPIQAQEVENIIPKSVLDELTWTEGNRGAKEKYDAIWNSLREDENGWKYVDLKSGIKKTDKNKDDIQCIAFMKKIYDLIPGQHTPFEIKFSCASTPGEIMVGLSKSILKQSVDLLEAKSDEQLSVVDNFLPFQEIEWNQIGQMVLNVGICTNEEATNY